MTSSTPSPSRRDRRVAIRMAHRRRARRRVVAVAWTVVLLVAGASSWSAGVRPRPRAQEAASRVVATVEATTGPTQASTPSAPALTNPPARVRLPAPTHSGPRTSSGPATPPKPATSQLLSPPLSVPPTGPPQVSSSPQVSSPPQVTALSCAATGTGAVLRGSAAAGSAPVTVVMSLGGLSQTRLGPAGASLSFSMTASLAPLHSGCSVSVASSAGQGRATAVVR
jgi:hypothetical protein